MNYLSQQLSDHENSLTYPDKLWVVMYNELENWSDPVADRYEAEQIYWSAKDIGEDVSFGYTYDGSFNSRWIDNIRNFVEVKI